MNSLVLLSFIIRRDREPELYACLDACGLTPPLAMLCEGTAGRSLLDLLGLEASEKLMACAVCSRGEAALAMRRTVSRLGLSVPGEGLAFTVPLGSVGGKTALRALTGLNDLSELSEVTEMPASFPYEALCAICEHGYADQVMTAARAAGARGGTILHARGTAPKEERFLRMTIAPEKDAVLILTPAAAREPLMRALMEKCGPGTTARAVVFSLPVEAVEGLSMEEP